MHYRSKNSKFMFDVYKCIGWRTLGTMLFLDREMLSFEMHLWKRHIHITFILVGDDLG